jgi:Rrf2 family protein
MSLREISTQEKLPVKFLEQIMMVLKRNNFVESVKGKHGGYSLSRPPAALTIGKIIRAVEGPLAPVGTAREIERKIQKEEHHAGLYSVLLDVRNAIADILDKKTLADVCEKSLELARQKPERQMYYI